MNAVTQNAAVTTETEVKVVFPPKEQLMTEFGTKSSVIRHLATTYGHGKGKNLTGAIAKHLGLRYQHVRNVLTQELKVGPRDNKPAVADTNNEDTPAALNAEADNQEQVVENQETQTNEDPAESVDTTVEESQETETENVVQDENVETETQVEGSETPAPRRRRSRS